MTRTLALALVLSLGAPLLAQEKPPQEPAAEETGTPPFTARQIREFTKAGRKYVFRIEAKDEAPRFSVIEFVSVDADAATMRHQVLGADKKPLEGEPQPPEEQVSWEDLEGHARFPKAHTTITEGEVSIPAGKFKAVIFTVREGESTTTYVFAKDLPGAPVKVESREGDAVVFSMVLVEHTNE